MGASSHTGDIRSGFAITLGASAIAGTLDATGNAIDSLFAASAGGAVNMGGEGVSTGSITAKGAVTVGAGSVINAAAADAYKALDIIVIDDLITQSEQGVITLGASTRAGQATRCGALTLGAHASVTVSNTVVCVSALSCL